MASLGTIPPSKKNVPPSADGDVVEYINSEAKKTRYFNDTQNTIFINGMLNDNKAHEASAMALSLLVMTPVIGIFNKSTSGLVDFWQCVTDKYQFDGPLAMAAKNKLTLKKSFSDVLDFVQGKYPQKSRKQIVEDILSRNPAAVSAFRALRYPAYKSAPIYAHSQGNLILSNALTAIVALDGPQAIAGRKVFSFGSPTVNWPSGIIHQENAFTGDPVAMLSGMDMGFKISKVGSYPRHSQTRPN